MSHENKSLQSEGECAGLLERSRRLKLGFNCNNVFLNAKFSTVYCGLPISPDTRLISAQPEELIYTSS